MKKSLAFNCQINSLDTFFKNIFYILGCFSLLFISIGWCSLMMLFSIIMWTFWFWMVRRGWEISFEFFSRAKFLINWVTIFSFSWWTSLPYWRIISKVSNLVWCASSTVEDNRTLTITQSEIFGLLKTIKGIFVLPKKIDENKIEAMKKNKKLTWSKVSIDFFLRCFSNQLNQENFHATPWWTSSD